ncbi:MAG: B12-binding domain-containing protein [Nitrososphaerales archaeon]
MVPVLEIREMRDKTEELKQAIIDGDEDTARRLAVDLLAEGSDPLKTIEKCVYPAVGVVGERFEKGEYFLTELMLSAEAMKTAVEVFTNKISREERAELSPSRNGTVLIGTVKGDVHEIGKNLVATMLKVNGFDVHDAGKDVAPDEFLEKADEVKADIIGLSALMTNTMLHQRETVEYLREKRGDAYRVIVGGAPTSQEWADDIGADGWAPDAPSAVALVKRVLEKGEPKSTAS